MPQVWRVSPLGRFGSAALLALLIVWWWWLLGSSALLGGIALGAAWYLFAWRPSVQLTAAHVVVHNPFNTTHVFLESVVGVEGGYHGLTLTTRDGAKVTAWAVQKTNYAKWFKRTVRSDQVAAAIMAAAQARVRS